jgi:hypothetical protein
MPKLIVKGWEKCGITRVFFYLQFQLQTMEANATITLFTNNFEIDENVEVKVDFMVEYKLKDIVGKLEV